MRLPRRERPTPWLGRVPAAGGHPPGLPCGPSCERPVKFRASEVSGSLSCGPRLPREAEGRGEQRPGVSGHWGPKGLFSRRTERYRRHVPIGSLIRVNVRVKLRRAQQPPVGPLGLRGSPRCQPEQLCVFGPAHHRLPHLVPSSWGPASGFPVLWIKRRPCL